MSAISVLDRLIDKTRVHFYKPIQIAEILYRDRVVGDIDLADLESYRNPSKKWRDKVSALLIGRVCTSSAKFQDNLFDKNAIPPNTLVELGRENRARNGAVEAHVYLRLRDKLGAVSQVRAYLADSIPATFRLQDFESLFVAESGLRRSMDKMFEITVFALFATLVRALHVEVAVQIGERQQQLLRDFSGFLEAVLGLTETQQERRWPAALYRAGVTNAADRGLDMWSNFGPVVQVKHLTLTQDVVEDIVEGINAERLIVVCRDAEREVIDSVLSQIGLRDRLQAIITFKDLATWYGLCMSTRYQEKLGRQLLTDLRREFDAEFPSIDELTPFLMKREYITMN
ncbi:MAG: HaeII family restriction endonuclease [Planctomycetaceae bacterium]